LFGDHDGAAADDPPLDGRWGVRDAWRWSARAAVVDAFAVPAISPHVDRRSGNEIDLRPDFLDA
jgi:hypothetical protein